MRTSLIASAALVILAASALHALDAHKDVRIVAFGDSLTYGTGSAKGGGYVTLLSQAVGNPIENWGVPGNTTRDALKRLPQVIKEKPDVAIVLLGGNDYLDNIPESETFKNLDTIITRLKQSGAKVLLLGLSSPTHGALDQAYFDTLAAKDTVAYVPNILGGIWGNAALMSDDLHPNDAGYAQMEGKIEPAVTKLLH